ncbi:tetratricopeptide repeat protein [Massilia sp. PWRC2]|uniref:tetratricopeptide repeat protein n=1 Tax=Massilia sp. PWRC2 TaxID=2804626 RepID=UPI003CF2C7DB
MPTFRLAHLGLVMAALGFTAATPVIGLSTAMAAETLRPEVGNPLQAAQALMKQGKNREALAKLRDADNVGNKTANESYLIERVRAAAASAAGDNEAAAKSFETLIASGKLSTGEKDKFSEGLVGLYIRAKDYPKANAAINRQLKDHDNPALRQLLIQNYYVSGNLAQAEQELRNIEKGGKLNEDQLGLLANIQLKKGDKAGYVGTIEKLAASYPKVSYWTDLLNRVVTKPGYSNRLTVDIYRLKLANNLLKKPSEFVEMAQLVLQAKAPAEALKVLDKGYKAGILGVGAEAPRHQRLKDLAEKNLAEDRKTQAVDEAALIKAKDQDGLLAMGYGLVQAGQADKGLQMMQDAIKAGGLRNPEDAKLHLGEAQAVAGKKAQALTTLKGVGGTDGTADLARYWIMAINHPMG